MKFLLLPLGILAFVLFLLVLGAIGLLVAMTVITAVRGTWRFVNRSGRPRRS